MAHNLVQAVVDANTAATSAAVGNDVAFTSNLTADNTLVVCDVIWSNPAHTIATPTATSHTFTACGAELAATDGFGKIRAYYEDDTAAGACTVHFAHDSGNAFHTNIISEHSGIAATPTLDKFATGTSSSTTTPVTGSSGTLAQADELVIGFMSHLGTDRAITAGSGYTNIAESETGTNSMPISGIYKVVAATTAVTADWTIGTGAVGTFQLLATFKLAAAGGTDATIAAVVAAVTAAALLPTITTTKNPTVAGVVAAVTAAVSLPTVRISETIAGVVAAATAATALPSITTTRSPTIAGTVAAATAAALEPLVFAGQTIAAVVAAASAAAIAPVVTAVQNAPSFVRGLNRRRRSLTF